MKVLIQLCFVLINSISFSALASREGMTQMPKINPKVTYTIESNEKGEDLQDQRGFGSQEPMVRMMNLMMVEGSGYEGMDMKGGMKVASDQQMDPAMPMQMKSQDIEKQPSAAASVAVYNYDLESVPAEVKRGINTLTISIKDAKTGKPVKGLKPKAQISMTSMDMGTDEARVIETAPGKYQLKANFSMQGPWAVKLSLPKEEKVFALDVKSSK